MVVRKVEGSKDKVEGGMIGVGVYLSRQDQGGSM